MMVLKHKQNTEMSLGHKQGAQGHYVVNKCKLASQEATFSCRR